VAGTTAPKLGAHSSARNDAYPVESGTLPLGFSHQYLSDVIADTTTRSLTVLDFANNNFTGSVPNSYWLLPELYYLAISGNPLMEHQGPPISQPNPKSKNLYSGISELECIPHMSFSILTDAAHIQATLSVTRFKCLGPSSLIRVTLHTCSARVKRASMAFRARESAWNALRVPSVLETDSCIGQYVCKLLVACRQSTSAR